MFESFSPPSVDALYRTAAAYAADPRPDKLDLGVGVYRDENGLSPVMRSVRIAEERLCAENETKAYLPLAGEPGFLAGMSALLFDGERPDNVAAVQSVGGTGGIRLALELAQQANPDVRVHLGIPSWPNHQGISDRLKIPVSVYHYLNDRKDAASLDNARNALRSARRGDVLIVHGPCHNPTGLDLPSDEVVSLLREAASMGVIPLIDAAYYGLGNPLDEDLTAIRNIIEQLPECFVAMSGSKAFGLYRDRIGILFIKCRDGASAELARGNAEVLARVNYSAPAAHGAQVIGTILSDQALKEDWQTELASMRGRMTALRQTIKGAADDHPALQIIWRTKGIFSLLPFGPEVTEALAEQHAIHMPPTARVNLAGLSPDTAVRFVDAVKELVAR